MTTDWTTDMSTGGLVKLGDTDLTIAEPEEDIRGRAVIDRNGEEIGRVDALLIDDRESKVRCLRVASGGFLGIGEQTFLLPVGAITLITEDQVMLDQTRERVARAPVYNPNLVYDRDCYSHMTIGTPRTEAFIPATQYDPSLIEAFFGMSEPDQASQDGASRFPLLIRVTACGELAATVSVRS